MKRGVLGPVQILSMFGFVLRNVWRDGRGVLPRNKAYLRGLRRKEIEAHADAFVASVATDCLNATVVARLNEHIRAGDAVAMMTGTPDFLAVPLAAELGIEHVIATRCAATGDVFSSAPPERHPYGITKRELARDWCEQMGSTIGAATAYADSWQDRFLLTAVGRPIAVAPDRRLRRLARRLKWEIIEKSSPPRVSLGTVAGPR
jgi:phosphoserine phosphatase